MVGDAVGLVEAGSLTVAAVAARLGVAASTLRTWDRRYGLGPSGRVAGRHRRYSARDVARLETMRALTERGMSLAEAAQVAAESVPEASADVDPLTLAAAATDARLDLLVRMLHAAAASRGLLGMLLQRVVPARALLGGSVHSGAPGRAPQLALTAAALTVVRERSARAPEPTLGPVLVLARCADLLEAHVLAGELHEAGVRCRVASLSGPDPAERTPDEIVVEVDGGDAAAVLADVLAAVGASRPCSDHRERGRSALR